MAVLLTAILWSTSGLFIKLLDWHPMVIICTRSVFSVIFLLVVRLIVPPGKGVKSHPFPLWAGAIAYALTMLTFVTANKITTSANAIMLQYSAPVWAALLGWRLNREKPHWEQWGAMVLVFAGMLLFLRDGLGTGALLGDMLAVMSGIAFGANSVFLRMLKNANPRDAMLLAHVISAAAGLPFLFLYPPSVTAPSALSIIYMGTIQLGAASLVYAYGMKRISAVKAMLTAIIEPLLNPVWVLVITGERPTPIALLGGTIIIASVLASSMIGMRRDELYHQSIKQASP